MGAATTARARMLAHASPLIRLLGQRDALCHENSLLERELEVFRSQRQRKAPHQRPHYAPEERARILEVMRLRGWTVKQAAQRFVVHPNTIRNWRRAVEDRTRSDRLLGRPPWNRLHDGVRGVVLELRRAFPEPEFGTRTIARHLVRAGIRISRTSVRRVLQEHQGGPRSRGEHARRVTQPTHHIRHPVEPNRVWHLDLTEIRVLWLTVTLAAIVDGFTRKIVALRASRARPTSEDVSALVAESVVQAGRRPRFLVTDHGSQFRRRFTAKMRSLGIDHVACPVRTWQLNAKIERVFRDVKRWACRSWLPLDVSSVQARLDDYREWHNRYRPHAAHGTLTPDEAEHGARLPDPIAYTERGGVEPRIRLRREHVGNDRRLAYPVIRVTEHPREAA
jgi:transposase-like protein